MQQAGKRAREEQLRWAETPAAARPRALCMSWSCCCCLFYTLSGVLGWCQPPFYISSSRWRCCASRIPGASRLKFGLKNPPVSVSGPSVRPSICLPTHTHTSLTLSSLSFYCLCSGRIFRSLCTGRLKCLPGRFPGNQPQSSHLQYTLLHSSPVWILFYSYASVLIAPPLTLCLENGS